MAVTSVIVQPDYDSNWLDHLIHLVAQNQLADSVFAVPLVFRIDPVLPVDSVARVDPALMVDLVAQGAPALLVDLVAQGAPVLPV